MNKTLKKTLLIAGITVAVCAAVWGGLTLARNAQRGDVNVYQVSDFAMTDYWGDTANTSGTVNTDKLQKIYISETQEVSVIYVKEGQNVKKGDKLLSFDIDKIKAAGHNTTVSVIVSNSDDFKAVEGLPGDPVNLSCSVIRTVH